jgi:hypothetical protein
MKKYGGVDIYIYVYLTSILVIKSAQLHDPAALHHGKEPSVPIG